MSDKEFKPLEGTEYFNLMEAVDRTGRSTGSFYSPKNKALLEEYGAATGGVHGWQIPEDALVRIGWLHPDGSPVPVKKGRKSAVAVPERSLSEVNPDDAFELLTVNKEDLVGFIQRLQRENDKLSSDLASLKRENKSLRDTVELLKGLTTDEK